MHKRRVDLQEESLQKSDGSPSKKRQEQVNDIMLLNPLRL